MPGSWYPAAVRGPCGRGICELGPQMSRAPSCVQVDRRPLLGLPPPGHSAVAVATGLTDPLYNTNQPALCSTFHTAARLPVGVSLALMGSHAESCLHIPMQLLTGCDYGVIMARVSRGSHLQPPTRGALQRKTPAQEVTARSRPQSGCVSVRLSVWVCVPAHRP